MAQVNFDLKMHGEVEDLEFGGVIEKFLGIIDFHYQSMIEAIQGKADDLKAISSKIQKQEALKRQNMAAKNHKKKKPKTKKKQYDEDMEFLD